jgi:hypothetical protein
MSTAAAFPPPAPAGPALAAAVRAIEEQLAQVQELVGAGGLRELSDAAAADLTLRIHRAGEACAAVTAVGVARVADSGYPAVEGYVSPASWWRAKTRTGRDGARDQVMLARRLDRHYEATANAWGEGRIDREQAEILTTGLDGVLGRLARHLKASAKAADQVLTGEELGEQVAAARAEFEARFLHLATSWGTDTLRTGIKAARQLADPDGGSAAVMRALSDSTTTITDVGDMALIKSYVTQGVAAMVRAVLDHYRNAAYHAGMHTTAKSGAVTDLDPVSGEPVTITNAQLDAIALADWVTSTLDRGLGSEKISERPHLDITATLTELATASAGEPGVAVLVRTGCPIPVQSARRAGCDAHVRLVLTDGQYRDPHTGQHLDQSVVALMLAGIGILDHGRSVRIVPQDLRRALALRDRGCAFPGCHRPPAHTEAHHVRHWIDGGKTSSDNTVLLCSRHHHHVHEGRWRITPRAGLFHYQPGYWHFTPPDPPNRN